MAEYIPLIIDAALVLIVLLAAVIAWNKGLITTLVNFLGLAVSAFAAVLFCKPAAQWGYDRFLKERVVGYISEKLPASLASSDSSGMLNGIDSFRSSVTSFAGELLSSLGLDSAIFSPDMDAASGEAVTSVTQGVTTAQAIADNVVGPIVLSILTIAAFLLIFFVVLLVVKLLGRLGKGINKVPVVGAVNKVLGGVFGVAQGLLIIYLVAIGLKLLVGAFGSGWELLNADALSRTRIASWLMNFKLPQ